MDQSCSCRKGGGVDGRNCQELQECGDKQAAQVELGVGLLVGVDNDEEGKQHGQPHPYSYLCVGA
jgi:hypothetical protein